MLTREYQSAGAISGPLLFVERVQQALLGEMVSILMPGSEIRRGQVIELSEKHTVIQVLEDTAGMSLSNIRIRFSESVAQMDLSIDLLGRRFNGSGVPIDHLPPVIPEKRLPIPGSPINPLARAKPSHFIQTGISTIDGLNTLVRGQKLPIFSGAGLPAKEIAAQIFRQAEIVEAEREPGEIIRKSGDPHKFAIVFGAIGIPFREAAFFIEAFEESGVADHTVAFLNLADDPTIERLLTPRYALTAAEYLAFEQGYHVLVLLTDMTNYCEALREIATAREEIPGRRGFPGYMYTDLATLYERAGRIKGRKGSVTQIPILTMPDDDMSHPVPDLTGYITEGQIVLSRELHRKGIYPPIDVLPCLSRLMNQGIGKERTREDHREVADQLYALYAQGRDARRLESIVGAEGLSDNDERLLEFAGLFETRFVNQGRQKRTLQETLGLSWELFKTFPAERLARIKPEFIQRYYKQPAK
ncbi:MAG: V-type ATP synthase subunit B [Nitrospirae bacterium]|nr:V-type ATP synthase subunit B [Nitrospirota bacterium]